MRTRRGIFLLTLCGVLAALAPLAVPAATGSAPFYFVARPAPEGSLTAAGQDRQRVYLRWDLLDGTLPPDLARIELFRDGDLLLSANAGAVMSATEIAALYAGAAQARRLQETLTLLREQAAAEGASFTVGAFGGVVQARLDPASPAYDPAWAALAAQADFNIARARHRAYLDAPGNGVFSYELVGVSIAEERRRLGLVTIDTTAPTQLLGATALGQLREDLARCDLPEAAKDHHTVALTWQPPGANVADVLAAQAYLAGFDLYRTEANVPAGATAASVARDLAAEAAVADFDARGVPLIPGLERVNTTLINDPGGNAPGPKWLETPADLARDGVQAGDRRAYYLVPRDFTGNYGPTAVAIVEVPNLVRPPAPWRIQPFADQTGAVLRAGENLSLSWDAINLDNYLAAFGGSRRVCNAAAARTTGVLEFVGPDQDCATDPRRTVRLDVAGYAVYRFEDFASAESFRDSDLDGVGDFIERPAGMQCDAERQPDGSSSQLVWPLRIATLELEGSGREVVRFLDEVPAGDKGRVYWYRVASYTADGRASVLSPPVRGLFPDRELPPAPTVDAKRPGLRPEGCRAEVRRTTGPWLFQVGFEDASQPFSLRCGGTSFTGLTEKTLEGSCTQVSDACAGQAVSISYPAVADTGGKACDAFVPAGVEFCSAGEVILVPEFAADTVPAATGETVAGPLEIEVVAPNADTCVSLYQDIDGDQVRIGTSCGTDDPVRLNAIIPAGYFCGYAVAQDGNNNISPPANTPCVLVFGERKPPAPPQLLDFSATDGFAQLRWRLPPEPLAAVLVRLRHQPAEGDAETRVISVPVAGFGSGEPVNRSTPIAALLGTSDQWCVSLRSVGVHGSGESAAVSDWSPQRCVTRDLDVLAPPEYLPWPVVAGPVIREPLPVSLESIFDLYGATTDNPGSIITTATLVSSSTVRAAMSNEEFELLLGQLMPTLELARTTGLGRACGRNTEEVIGFPPLPALECGEAGRLQAQATLEPAVGFLVYRQLRRPDGTLGDWQQVSPLIEFAHWDRIDKKTLEESKIDVSTRLNDPYIKILPVAGEIDTWRFLFVDRYPLVNYLWAQALGEGRDYRYQLVYFDDRHSPVAWRQSGWVEVR